MKKSEMIQKLDTWGNEVEPPPTTREMISLLLDKLVELGMSPPSNPEGICVWEQE